MAKATTLPPVPTDPVELISTPLARSGLAAGAPLRRGGNRLVFHPGPALPFPPPPRYEALHGRRAPD